MKLLWLFLSLIFIFSQHSYAQYRDSTKVKIQKETVYRIRPLIDGTIIAGGLVSNYFGIRILKGKDGLDSAKVVTLSPDDVRPKWDRGAARQDPDYAEKAMLLSDVYLYGSFLLSAGLLFDKKIRHEALSVGVVLLTTSSVMANAYSWGVGHINKYRPYVYNTKESIERRTRNGSRNSFYGGHAAAAAAASFFIAKVYHDYNPGSKLTPYLFAGAIIPPTIVSYYRYKAGMHFPSDLIVGVAAGAGIGILIPQLHKRKSDKLTLLPSSNGIYISYQID
ncbi:MAG TPA: phosphatase PAP2 family protein [Cytophagaceae bacterium]